jgi:Effector-associated domain 2
VLEAALVAWLIAALGDRTLKGLKLLVKGKPEREALLAAMQVASGALLERVPAPARAGFAAALSNCLSQPPAIVLDGEIPVKAALVEGMLAQVRPLADASITTSGRSYLDEVGVPDSVVLADLPDFVIRSIQQVGAGSPALQPLVGQLNADIVQDDTRQILAAVQALLLRAGDGPKPAAANSFRELTVTLLDPIVDAMQRVPAIADHNARNTLISVLRPDIQGAVSRSTIGRLDILNLVRTCARYTGGLEELLTVVRIAEGDSEPMRHLEHTIHALTAHEAVRGELENGPGA